MITKSRSTDGQSNLLMQCTPVFRHVHKVAKNELVPCLSIRLSSWSNWATTGQILMKFYIEDFLKARQ